MLKHVRDTAAVGWWSAKPDAKHVLRVGARDMHALRARDGVGQLCHGGRQLWDGGDAVHTEVVQRAASRDEA